MLKTRRSLIIIGSILIVIGAVGFAFPFLPFRFNSDYEYLNYIAAQASENAPIASSSSQARPSIDPNHPSIKNRLVINSIGVNMPLVQSKGAEGLLKGGWVFPGGATPETGGNSVVFGHRVRYVPPISNTFYNLDKIHEGDRADIIWNGHVYHYMVVSKKLIDPTDVSVLAASSTSRITLITCAPLFSTKQRLAVVAELVP